MPKWVDMGKMTDANLKDPWLGDPRFDDLSDRAWRVFTGGLMWANRQGTNGDIPQRYLSTLHPDGAGETELFELDRAKIWETTATGKRFIGWVDQLGQSSAEMVEHRKAINRAKAARAREREAEKLKALKEQVTGELPGVRKTRQDKTRQDQKLLTGELSEAPEKPMSWPVVAIPRADTGELFNVPAAVDLGGNYASR
jgi:hypothetical protein